MNSPKPDRRLAMHYTKEERLNIGQRIYNGEITRYQAAEEYGISDQTARDYMRLYRDANHLPPKRGTHKSSISVPNPPTSMEDLASMSKEELIEELIKARIAEARLKKGYEVKGDGSIIRYVSKNTK
jgi:transposase